MAASIGPQIQTSTHSKTTSTAANPRHLYQGHRSRSFIVHDVDQLTEWRARQRTFDGAYLRTALGCSFYALAVLKFFHREFAKIGLAFAFLALLILMISWMRRRRLNHDFSDKHFPESVRVHPIQPGPRIWGRDYQTPGDLMLLMGVSVAALQLGILVVLFNLD